MQNNTKTTIGLLKEKAKNISVLYVEDEEILRITTADFLSKLFQKVEVAVDGKDGLDKYLHAKYDIVITDITMPNMNGLELISSIRKYNLHQEIIVMSAHTDQVNTADVAGFIFKPVEMNQMVEILVISIDRLNPFCSNKDT